MRLMAVAARHAGRKHLALLERAVIVDLVAHLPIGIVEPACKRRDDVGVRQGSTRQPCLGKFAAPRMAEAARLNLFAQLAGGKIAKRLPRSRVGSPRHVLTFVETNDETFGRIILFGERPPAVLVACPRNVARSLSVTSLAADADFREGRGEAVVRRVIVLVHAGRMALGAHEIPVLVQLRPMQDIVVLDLFIGIKVKPALSAFVLRSAVPGERQCLQPAVRKFDEILLERIDAEGVFHFERRELAVRTIGLDKVLPVLAKEAGVDAVIVEACVVEVAQNRFAGRVLHCE